MSENKGERQQPLPQQSQNQVSPSSKELSIEEEVAAAADQNSQSISHHRQPLIISSITASQFISTPPSISPRTTSIISSPQQQFDQSVGVKRPRFSPNPTGQWKLVSSPSHFTAIPSSTAANNPPSSSDTASASSPSHSPILSLPTSSDTTTTAKPEAGSQQFRKGKYVSPVWKPHEMLWLARAWRVQYQGASNSATDIDHLPAGAGRGKTRAEKDREVAEFLKSHGVNRDAKTAGTKWDNMLGEFRKVYEWERGGEREQIGKSYFRLSPYERKIHRLPASFDEEVFEELAQFMGSRIRSSSSSSAISPSHGRGIRSTPLSFLGSFGSDEQQHFRATSLMKPFPSAPPLPPLREDDTSFSGRTRQLVMAGGIDQSYLQGARANLLGFDASSSPLDMVAPSSSVSSRELCRIGRIRMTWEESVSLWADEEGELHKGRVKLQGSNFLNADDLTYFDESMVACAFESFTDGPLKGFSVDRFVAGQQLKVLGRRKPAHLSTAPSGSFERLLLPPSEAPTRSTPSWEIMTDPTDYYMGCLRAPPLSLPSLYDLSWHVQDPLPEEFRFPLRKDLYRDLPPGKELFATSSNDLLDSRCFTIDILSPLIRTPVVLTTPTSRDSYIGLWDDCVNRLISRFCPVQMTIVRKSTASSDADLRDQWPNVTAFVKNLCLWRGEETDKLRGVRLDPSNSIVEKLLWSYGDLPYILGYHAVGPVVTFCALSRSPDLTDSKIIRTDIYSLDLSVPSERIKALVPCWRIACLLPLLAERFFSVHDHGPSRLRFSDFARVEHGPGQVSAEMTPRTVTRFYSTREKWSAAKEVYDVLDHQVPYTERMTGWSEADLSITFAPRGVMTKPATAEELVEALKHVTKALVALHDLCFMHRDLSWEKVLRRCDKEGEWVLCGFEEMVAAPQINKPIGPGTGPGSGGKRAPEMERSSGVHGVKVDVWGVGYLVRTSGLVVGSGSIPKQLKELESRCLDQNPELRPTAADCYHHLLQFQAAVSTAAVGDSYGR